MTLRGTLTVKNTLYGKLAVSQIDKTLPSVKELSVDSNGRYEVPSGYDGFNPVLVNVAPKPEQEKTVDISKNGYVQVQPDAGKALSKVNVNVDVPLRYDEGYNNGYDDGFDEGAESIKLQEKSVTENGELLPDKGYNGFSKVQVDVPLRYDEGYNDGFDDGAESIKLQEKSVTENGELLPDSGYNGFSKVDINVPERYDEGYTKGYSAGYTTGEEKGFLSGVASVKLMGITISENGEYEPDNGHSGFSKVIVNVPDRCIAETWVLELEDGSTVTKEVKIKDA